MLAVESPVFEPVWITVQSLIPPIQDNHPLGCHRPRVSDQLCFKGIVTRLVTGCSWAVAAYAVGIGETTLRRRRTEWLHAGVFATLVELALSAYDTVIGLDLDEVAVDGSLHKAPMGGVGTGPSHVDRAKLGWKWSLATERAGIPIGWVCAAANTADLKLLEDTLDTVDARGYELEIRDIYLDRGYDAASVREMFAEIGITAHIPPRSRRYTRRRKAGTRPRHRYDTGPRWIIERTNSWLSNFGQLRRSTDRKPIHREAALDLAIAFVLTIKLVKYHKRYGTVLAR